MERAARFVGDGASCKWAESHRMALAGWARRACRGGGEDNRKRSRSVPVRSSGVSGIASASSRTTSRSSLCCTSRTVSPSCTDASPTVVATPFGTVLPSLVSSSGVTALSLSSADGLPTSGRPAGSSKSKVDVVKAGAVLLVDTSVRTCTASCSPGSERCSETKYRASLVKEHSNSWTDSVVSASRLAMPAWAEGRGKKEKEKALSGWGCGRHLEE